VQLVGHLYIKAISLCEELFLKLVSYRPVLEQGPKSENRKLFCGFMQCVLNKISRLILYNPLMLIPIHTTCRKTKKNQYFLPRTKLMFCMSNYTQGLFS